jgi:signal transduction histidine kinase
LQPISSFDGRNLRFVGSGETVYLWPMLATVLKSLKAVSPPVLVTVLTAVTLVIGYFDYLAGTDTTFSAIYLFPIAAAAWFVNLPAAYALSILSSLLWVSGDIEAGAHYTSVFVPLWNLAARLAIFVFGANMAAALRRLHTDLERRATERAVKLTEEIARRERLQRELLHISEREQERVGHDIHDSLCQHLTGTALAAEVLSENLQASNLSERHDAETVVVLIEEGITLARNLARGLSGVEVSKNGLMAALSDFAESTSNLFNMSCRFECPEPLFIEDTDTAVHLYRIAQEAVSNAIKHGEAEDVVIRLESSDAGCTLRVIDNGWGLPAKPVQDKGMGLRIMSYRSELIGADLDIRRRSPKGTEVTCTLRLAEVVS